MLSNGSEFCLFSYIILSGSKYAACVLLPPIKIGGYKMLDVICAALLKIIVVRYS